MEIESHEFPWVHGSRVYGWKVQGTRVHGWRIWVWKVQNWSLSLKCHATIETYLLDKKTSLAVAGLGEGQRLKSFGSE